MKKLFLIIFISTLSTYCSNAQDNGFYFCDDYEFIDSKNPQKSYRIQSMNYLLISLNVIQGKFTGGEFFWEWSDEKNGAICYKWKIHSIKNSGIQNENLFYKSYLSSMEVLGIDSQVYQDIYIIRNLLTNTYDIAIYNSESETKMFFHNIKKIEKL